VYNGLETGAGGLHVVGFVPTLVPSTFAPATAPPDGSVAGPEIEAVSA
jgi:hypothetical protein